MSEFSNYLLFFHILFVFFWLQRLGQQKWRGEQSLLCCQSCCQPWCRRSRSGLYRCFLLPLATYGCRPFAFRYLSSSLSIELEWGSSMRRWCLLEDRDDRMRCEVWCASINIKHVISHEKHTPRAANAQPCQRMSPPVVKGCQRFPAV